MRPWRIFQRGRSLSTVGLNDIGALTQCFDMIKDGTAELTTVDGGDGFLAHGEYSIHPLLYENYGEDDGTQYYTVAVVNEVLPCIAALWRNAVASSTGLLWRGYDIGRFAWRKFLPHRLPQNSWLVYALGDIAG